MASPITLLKKGIEDGDWAKVCRAYKGITGEELNPPVVATVQLTIPDDFGDRVASYVLQMLAGNEVEVATPPPSPAKPSTKKPKPKAKRQTKSQTVGFVDDGTIAPEEIEESRRLSQTRTPVERRPKVKYIDVICCKCNKTFNVHPALGPKKIDANDESSFVCDGCQLKGVSR